MVNKVLGRLNILKQKNSNPCLTENRKSRNWVNKDSELYPFFFKKEMYILACANIKSNKSLLTLGTDNKALTNFPDKSIQIICNQIKTEQYTFSKFETKVISKASGKFKFLGIPRANDKIVEEIIRIILEAIWDSPEKPQFSEVSHKVRSGKGTHSALQYIDQKFQNIKWIIQGDIKKTYDNINHNILMNILEKQIS